MRPPFLALLAALALAGCNGYSPWDSVSMSGALVSCAPPGATDPACNHSCPATALCDCGSYVSYSGGSVVGFTNCAPLPKGCTIGNLCACSPWFTTQPPPTLDNRSKADSNVCYSCREIQIDGSRTSVSCLRYDPSHA